MHPMRLHHPVCCPISRPYRHLTESISPDRGRKNNDYISPYEGTGWRRLIGSPKLQIIFHKRATKYRAFLRKMTYKDKGSYESSPPCNILSPYDYGAPYQGHILVWLRYWLSIDCWSQHLLYLAPVNVYWRLESICSDIWRQSISFDIWSQSISIESWSQYLQYLLTVGSQSLLTVGTNCRACLSS